MATRSSSRSQPFWLFALEGSVLIVAILYFAKPVIIPLALAVLLTFVLTPIVAAVQRSGSGRVPAVLVVVCFTFLVLGSIGWGVGVQVQRLAHDLPSHKAVIKEKIDSLRGSGEGAIARVIRMIEEIGNSPPDQTGTSKQEDGKVQEPPANPNKGMDFGTDRAVIIATTEKPSAIERLSKMVEPVLEPLAITGLVIILVVFMLIKREDLRNRVISLLGHGHLTGTTRLFVDTAERLSSYLLNQLLVNAGFGIVFGISLFCLGVPYAFLWGFLTALLRFVPYIGSWIALAFPLLLSFALAPSWTQPVLVLALFAVFDLVTANVIEPLVFGHSTGVTPIALLIAAAFWSWLWGSIGLVLSTPLTVCLVVLGQHIPRFKFLALLLSDEPALPPHATYYQRLLARDRNEAKEVIQRYVEANGLERVFDDVFLPALVLTRRDRKLGGLTPEEEEFIYQTTREILEDLSTQPSVLQEKGKADTPEASNAAEIVSSPVIAETPDARPQGLILGCPAHHEAEELSLYMLAQLLKADHCTLEVVSTRTLPAEVEARIEQEKPALVFIAVLPPGGLVQAVYLCKRLRKAFPNLPIIVGYWSEARDFDRLLVRLRSAGAGYLTTSLIQSRSQVRAMVQITAPGGQEPVLAAAGKS